MNYKITYHAMGWELDYCLQTFTQLKKSKYYLSGEDNIEINPVLNLSSYIFDWEKSKLSKDLLKSRFNQYLKLLKDYKVTAQIYEGDELYGHLDHQREAISSEVISKKLSRITPISPSSQPVERRIFDIISFFVSLTDIVFFL